MVFGGDTYTESDPTLQFYGAGKERQRPMKFVLHRLRQNPSEYWNGRQALPDELTVQSPTLAMAEFQLLALLCSLHGRMSPYDLLTGCEPDTEKDRDMVAVLTAFQWYSHPRMPLTAYTGSGARRAEGVGGKP
jgi:hypothetical protein